MSRIIKRAQKKAQNALSTAKGKVAVVATAGVVMATNASAAITIAPIDTADFMTIAAAVVTALGVFFGVKKAIQLIS